MILQTKYQPIFITGAERSGSTIIARILHLCGVWKGSCNNMYENNMIHTLHHEALEINDVLFPATTGISIPVNWHDLVLDELYREGLDNAPWMIKGSFLAQYWPIWDYSFPDAKWLIIRRRTGDIVESCIKTGYMRTFKNEENLVRAGVSTEAEGWLWWVRKYEEKFVEIIQKGVNCRIVWPERMVSGNFEQMYETIKWLGLEWNNRIPEVISPLLEKSRRAK